MAESDFKVSVGVELDDASFTSLQNKINKATDTKVKLDIKNASKQIDSLVKQLDDIGVEKIVHLNTREASNKVKLLKDEIRSIGTTNISLSGTTKIEASLDKIVDSVDELKSSLSSLGRGSNFGNIANAAAKTGSALSNSAADVKRFASAVENINLSHTEQQIENLERVMNDFGFSPKAKSEFVQDIKEINLAIDSITTKANKDNTIDFTIKGVDELGRAVTAVKQVRRVLNEDGSINFDITKSSVKVAQDFSKISKAAKKSADEIAKSIDGIKKGFDTGELSYKVERIKQEFVKMGNEGNAAFSELNSAWNKFKDSYGGKPLNDVNADELIKSYEHLNLLIEKADNKAKELKLFPVDELEKAKSISVVETYIQRNTKASKQFGNELNRILDLLKEVSTTAELNRVMKEFGALQKKISAAGMSGQSLTDKMKEKIKEYGSYFSLSEIIMESIQALEAMAQAVIEVDTAMTGLYRVTDLTTAQYDQLYDKMVASAKAYGQTLTDTINATSDWVKAGFDNTDVALGLAEITSMYQNISDLDYDTASQNLITAYNGFKDQFESDFSGDAVAAVGHITDVLNQLDNEFAVTSAGLGESLTRSASAMQVAGNTFEETVA